jgi:hypothetical protein
MSEGRGRGVRVPSSYRCCQSLRVYLPPGPTDGLLRGLCTLTSPRDGGGTRRRLQAKEYLWIILLIVSFPVNVHSSSRLSMPSAVTWSKESERSMQRMALSCNRVSHEVPALCSCYYFWQTLVIPPEQCCCAAVIEWEWCTMVSVMDDGGDSWGWQLVRKAVATK